jgi:hypothetical protein
METSAMADMEFLSVIRARVDEAAAREKFDEISGGPPASIERKLYYPYYRYRAECRIPTLFGKKVMAATCLVDALNGIAATADPISVDHFGVAADARLQVTVAINDADRAARRVLVHQLGRRSMMIAPFEVDLEPLGVVHKGFWIARSNNIRFMIDSMTGLIHPLRTRAA